MRSGNLYLLSAHMTHTIRLVWKHCSKGGWVSRNPCLTEKKMQENGVTEPSPGERKEE